jgi:hypothetical protein
METKDGLANPGIKQGDTGTKRGKGTKRKADEAMTQAKSKKPKKTKQVDSLFMQASKAFAADLYTRISTENDDNLLTSINSSLPSDILVEAYTTIIKRHSKDNEEFQELLWKAESEIVKLKYENDTLKEDIDQLLNDRYDIDQLLG